MNGSAKVAGFKYNPETLRRNLLERLERLKWRQYIKSDSRVFVKPNFTVPFPKPGVTTDKVLIETLLGILKDRSSEVYIGESDGGSYSFSADYSLKTHGIPEMCKRTGATELNLSKVDRVRVTDNINGERIDVTLPRPLLGMDESISIPVLKVHVVTGVSLSIKNLWGCHPDTLRLFDHSSLSRRLALIAKSIKLRFSIIDAIYGLNRRGPMEGDVVKIGAILLGDNPVGVDAAATRLMGFDPASIEHITIANRYGLGPIKENDIELIDDLSGFQQQFEIKPTAIDRFGALTFKSRLATKLIFDSPLTKPIYKISGRRYHKKILKLGDEL